MNNFLIYLYHFRYGQKRSCFIYRLVVDKCLEKKIYDRQIKKQGMSDRVVDECNPDNHLSIKDVTNLCYDYDDEEEKEKEKDKEKEKEKEKEKDNKDNKDSNSEEEEKPTTVYADVILQKILQEYREHLTKEPFLHESLLVDRKNEKLSQAEKRLAHRSYEMQKKNSCKPTFFPMNNNRVHYQTMRKDGAIITKPIASVRYCLNILQINFSYLM